MATAANCATAVALVGVGWQLLLSRRQMVAQFEQTFVTRYEAILARIPLRLLRGAEPEWPMDDPTLRAFFDYFELCEEELYFRAGGRGPCGRSDVERLE